MFWIYTEKSVDNTSMFSLLLSSAYTESKHFPASHTIPPVSRLGVHKKLAEDTAGSADPNWPKGYSIPYDIMLSIQSQWKKKGRCLEWWCLYSQVTVTH